MLYSRYRSYSFRVFETFDPYTGEGNGNPLQYSCWQIQCTTEPGGLQFMASQSQAWLTNLNIRATHILRLCVSPMAQWVKNLPARQETWVWSLEEEMATCSSIPAWKNSMDRGAWYATLHGVTRVRQNWVTKYAAQILRLPWFTKKVNLLLSVSVVQTCTLIVNK